ncbi:hypothetical protein ZWY2020_047269 [Hordeum vulgare]|nr:hypothetical protein ZWY2020_047269 [Hordeum vulgare]
MFVVNVFVVAWVVVVGFRARRLSKRLPTSSNRSTPSASSPNATECPRRRTSRQQGHRHQRQRTANDRFDPKHTVAMCQLEDGTLIDPCTESPFNLFWIKRQLNGSSDAFPIASKTPPVESAAHYSSPTLSLSSPVVAPGARPDPGSNPPPRRDGGQPVARGDGLLLLLVGRRRRPGGRRRRVLARGGARGWLTKQGEYIKTWRRRWFVLKQGRLFWFKDAAVTRVGARGIIPSPPASPSRAPRTCSTASSPSSSTQAETMYFIADAEKEKEVDQLHQPVHRPALPLRHRRRGH